jgi:hypothetical protein
MMDRIKERMYIWIAYRLPRDLVKWCAIRVMAYACDGEWRDQIVPELTAMDALGRWNSGGGWL